MSLPRIERFEPGPCERSWRARLYRKLFGRWPQSVVAERLADHDYRGRAAQREMYRWIKDMYGNDQRGEPR